MAESKATSAAVLGRACLPERRPPSPATPKRGGNRDVSMGGKWCWNTHGLAQGPDTIHAGWSGGARGIRHGWSMHDLLPSPIKEVFLSASWVWVPKGGSLSPHLGFPATRREVVHFGATTRRIWRAPVRLTDGRSFLEVAKGSMDRKPQFQHPDQWVPNKRRAFEEEGGGGNWGNRNLQEREEHELRNRLMGQQQQREEGRWQQVERRGANKQWQGDRNREGGAWEGGDRRPTRGKEKLGEEGRSGPSQKEEIKCFNCGESGHHQVNCQKPPLCYVCKNPGHISSHCLVHVGGSSSNLGKLEVKLKGYDIPEQGFFSLNVDNLGVAEKGAQFRGILTVEKGAGSVQKVANEMSHLFREKNWDWNVKQISSNNFLIDFPSEDARRQVTKSGGLCLRPHPSKLV